MKLTKTNYILFRECAKNAWVKIHKPDIYYAQELSQFEKTIIESGNEVDELARKLFPNGILIKAFDDDTATKALINKKTPVIYQPVFENENYKAIGDILVWNNEKFSFDLYEVKASNGGEDKKAKDDIYAHDLAFQSIVINSLNIPLNNLYIIRLNNEYVRGVDLDINELLTREDFTEKVKTVEGEVKEEMKTAYEILSSEKEPPGNCKCIELGKSAHCSTFKHSNPEVPEYSVHQISRIGLSKKKLVELIGDKIFSIYDVPEDFPLSEIQRNQVDVAQTGKVIIEHSSIEEFLSEIKYPISFIDYETYPAAIPRFVGYSPFNQIPFQFSLHVLDEGTENLKHSEYIFTESSNPDIEFIKAMQKYLPTSGSIIVWNKSFEMGINRKLGERNPEYQKYLEDVNERMIDLEDPFKKQYLVMKDFKGRTSIKYILPALAPTFSYKNLDIQEGGTASDTWNKIVTNQYKENEKLEKINHLIEYCKLDTYAMYEIWKYLVNLI